MRKVEYLRRKMGMRQYRLARELGFNGSTMNRFEQGFVDPEKMTPRVRNAIEGYFKMTVHELLEDV